MKKARQIFWVYCSQVGLFKTESDNWEYRLRYNLTADVFWDSYCLRIFGVEAMTSSFEFNTYNGGTVIKASKVMLVSGSEDAWQEAGVIEPTDEQILVQTNCE